MIVTDERTNPPKEFTLHTEVDNYTRQIMLLIHRARPINEIDERGLRHALECARRSIYEMFLRELRRKDPGPEASYDDKVRFNLSIKGLKLEFNRASKRLRQTCQEWKRGR